MKRLFSMIVVLALIATGAVGGYVAGQRHIIEFPSNTPPVPAPAAVPQRERRVAYYQHPDGIGDFSPTPRTDDRGRPYVPVYEDVEPAPTPAPPPVSAANQGRGRVLFYRNPMGLPDTSPVPKKDSMGMDYIPVYENEAADDGSTVRVSLDRIQRIGVRTELVGRRSLARTIRAVGSIQFDERLQAVVAPRFEGWIVRVHAGVTGQPIGRGDPLIDVYSPELLQAIREYRLVSAAMRGEHDEFLGRLVIGARQRLLVFGLPESDIMALARAEPADGAITLRAPIPGIVSERRAVEGMRFAAGDMLYRVADPTMVWLVAEVFEQDIAQIAPGQETRVTVNAYPGRNFFGRVAFIYPMVSRETRTTRVRVNLPNTDGALRTDMYGNVEIRAAVGQVDALVVPDSAVLDSGTRQIVLVDRGEGRFEPRPVQLGARADGMVEVREGLRADERVVVSANFLIDAESNLRAALRAFTQDGSPR